MIHKTSRLVKVNLPNSVVWAVHGYESGLQREGQSHLIEMWMHLDHTQSLCIRVQSRITLLANQIFLKYLFPPPLEPHKLICLQQTWSYDVVFPYILDHIQFPCILKIISIKLYMSILWGHRRRHGHVSISPPTAPLLYIDLLLKTIPKNKPVNIYHV